MPSQHESASSFIELDPHKKIYFASDFHLGAPDEKSSLVREKKIIKWLDCVSKDAQAIFLVGDVFDFWFEYKTVIPKGFIRFQGKLAELMDRGISILLFTGNHDLWMFDYFPKYLDIPVYRQPLVLQVNEHRLYVGHGDGLGPGDHFYKLLKRVFTSPFFQWIFKWVHPSIGMGVATYWSHCSRRSNDKKEDPFLNENEWLLRYSKQIERSAHHDFYIFGHRHMPLEMNVSDRATYFNLGEWVNNCTYLVFDGKTAELKTFSG